MPLSEGLQRAIDLGKDPALAAAFEVMGILSTFDLLTYMPSFMDGVTLVEAELVSLSQDIRRLRDAAVPAATACGGYAAFPADATGSTILRRVVYAARLEAKSDVSAAPAVEEGKPLPAAELATIWQEGEAVTSGYCTVLPRYRLADSVVSRMSRSNKRGDLWIPCLDRGFSYRDSSSNNSITTLVRANSDCATGVDVELQLVQNPMAAERKDPVRLVADYLDVISHRSAALIACYCTPEAARAYRASAGCAQRTRHVSVSKGSELMLTPRMIGKLERALRTATRSGMSTSDVVRMDQTVIHAIHTRMADVTCDGNSAVEFVCDQQPTLFLPSYTSLGSMSSGPSTVADSIISPNDSVSNVSASTSAPKRSHADERLIAKLQSDRDKALHELASAASKRAKSDKGAGYKEPATVYGGKSGTTGGGSSSASDICRLYNNAEGCYRRSCQFRHACNRMVNGRPCGNTRHNACSH